MSEGHKEYSSSTKYLKMATQNSEVLKTKEIYEKFESIFKSIVDDLVINKKTESPEATAWFKKVIEYNVPHGKRNRGIAVIQSYLHLTHNNSLCQLSEKDARIVMVLGWCIEFLQSFLLVVDDIMDQSITRRGMPCWYKQKNVGLVAMNDALYLEACVYRLLRKHLEDTSYYVDILHLFHHVTHKTITGQCLDTMIENRGDGWMDEVSIDKYHQIVDLKTGYYSFYLPAACALYVAGVKDEGSHKEAETILLHMARYFQIQDDFLDCYGDALVTGKVGTDIEDGKYTWLLVEALRRADKQQKIVLQENYGKRDVKNVAAVKELYTELSLQKLFREFEEESYSNILSLIETSKSNLPKNMFLTYAERIYKRKK